MGPKGKKRAKGKANKAPSLDKYTLYQQAVQEPEADIEFIDEIFEERFGRHPRLLREDFCAAAFLACEWVAHHDDNGPIVWRRNLLRKTVAAHIAS